jgi:hypothetical protein
MFLPTVVKISLLFPMYHSRALFNVVYECKETGHMCTSHLRDLFPFIVVEGVLIVYSMDDITFFQRRRTTSFAEAHFE